VFVEHEPIGGLGEGAERRQRTAGQREIGGQQPGGPVEGEEGFGWSETVFYVRAAPIVFARVIVVLVRERSTRQRIPEIPGR